MANATKTGGLDKLKDAAQELAGTLGDRALNGINDKVDGLTDRLGAVANGGPSGKALKEGVKSSAGGGSGLAGGVKGAVSGLKDKVVDTVTGGGSKSNGSDATSSTNIIESIDVGVPLSVAYNQWTEFGAFPSFMKKVENVEADSDEKLTFKAQIFLSHREWEATVLEQVPDERIVWRSKGEKGHVDGAVTFHELAPNLTRILVVLEYYPQGLFEKTGNLWRAQGRRAKAELKHFRRHVMTRTALDPDSVEGWRGVIHEGEVVESHEDHVAREEEEAEDSEDSQDEDYEGDEGDDDGDEPEDEFDEGDEAEDEYEPEDEPEDEYDDEGDEDEYDDEDEPEDEYDDEDESDDEPEDEYDDEDDDEPEDEYDDEDDEEPEDEYDDEDDESDDEAEDEYDEDDEDDLVDGDDDEEDEEPERAPRRRRSSRRRAG